MEKDSKIWGFLAIFLGILGFILVLLLKKDDKYAMFWAKQSLVWTIAMVIVSIINIIPLLGQIIFLIGYIILLIVWLIGWINALSGKEKRLAIIGKFAEKINL